MKPKPDKGMPHPFNPMDRVIVGGMEPMIAHGERIDKFKEQTFFKTIKHVKTIRNSK
jgi:hypothetical protein